MRVPGTFSRCAVGLSLAVLASCNSTSQHGKSVEEVAATMRLDAYARADRLDEAAGSLEADGKRIGGAAGRALSSEAKADVATAETVRHDGDREADRIEGAGGAPLDAADGNTGTGG